MEKARTMDMTSGMPLKNILYFAVPACLGLLFQQFYSMVDTMLVGRVLGVEPLAGVGSTGYLNFMVVYFCIGVCSGFTVPVAQAYGAGKEDELRKFVANSVWLGIIFAVVTTAAVCFFCRSILTGLRTSDDIFSYAYDYIIIIFLGLSCTYLYNLSANIMRALGDSKSPLLFLVLSSALQRKPDGCRGSEMPIVPWKPGNAGRGKGRTPSGPIKGNICLCAGKGGTDANKN